jgi:RNA polymerase sigma-54 factor
VNPDITATHLNTNNENELKEASTYFQHLVTEANTLVNALKERETTMLNIITFIVKMQPDFFKTGDVQNLKPMILQDVANATGYDISTVSRITSNKYVQTPYGIFGLKSLFMRGLNAGEDVAPTTAIRVQEAIVQIIKEEDKTNPLSDNDIVLLLNKQGAHIARRTVVKYRESLSIPNSSLRKQEK